MSKLAHNRFVTDEDFSPKLNLNSNMSDSYTEKKLGLIDYSKVYSLKSG